VNFGNRYKGVEYAGWDDDTGTVRSRLMGTDGSRFTYTYEIDGNKWRYYFGDKGSSVYSENVIAPDGRSMEGRWKIPTPEKPNGGYEYRLTRLD
jgi:hypothetical protein